MIRMRYLQLFARWKNFALKLDVRSVFKTQQKFSPVLLFHFDIQPDKLKAQSIPSVPTFPQVLIGHLSRAVFLR